MGRKILLAVRIGEASIGPGRTAAWLARDLGATVTVLYVAHELKDAAQVATGAGLDVAAVRERMLEDAHQRADKLGREVLGDLPFEVVVRGGEVADVVAAVAAEIGADLVVTGTQGRGALKSVILGDTTREILRRTNVPVVVVPPHLRAD